MPQKYYNVKETAQMLGKTEEEVRQMLDNRELHGYRDGADWKFKSEDIERMAAEAKPPSAPAADDTDQVLLSEVELGQSGPGASGTVIGMEKSPGASESDIQIGESSIDLDTSKTPTPPIGKASPSSKATRFEELDLALQDDLTLAESDIGLDAKNKPAAAAPIPGSSSVDIAAKPLDDDDVVIGGSSSGSGITLSGDSGISLLDPADSGLSLEEPLELTGSSAEESLDLGEDDLLKLAESSRAGPALKTDDDFLLTPTEESAEAEESETGSQVIALDTDSEEAIGLGIQAPGMVAMLEEDLGAQPALDLGAVGVTPGLGMPAAALAEGPAVVPAGAYWIEAPYSAWNIVALAACVFFLLLCGAMVYDLLRNMWSWESAGSVNTWLMDKIIGLFE